jgi:hypothetical protein
MPSIEGVEGEDFDDSETGVRQDGGRQALGLRRQTFVLDVCSRRLTAIGATVK